MARSITHSLAEEALECRFENLPPEVVHQAKRHILDTLACALGAFDSDFGIACRDHARELYPLPQATLIGETSKVAMSSAIIANETMIRYLDFNDVLYFPKAPGKIGGSHPSDALAAVFALAEFLGSSGRQVIETTVAAYQTIGRIVDGLAEGLSPLGFHHGTVMPYGGAVIAGKLLGLDAGQITHAMGIGGSAAVGLGVNDAEGEEYNNTKNLADGLMVERGVLGAFLAKRGVTGPERIIEGNKGFAHSVLRGVNNFTLKPVPNLPYIMQTRTKFYPTESTNQGHLYATSLLVQEHHLQPEDIESIFIRTNKRAIEHNGDPAKKYPNNKETADHSAYFMTALAIVTGGRVMPSSFTEAAYSDPVIRDLTDRVILKHVAEYDAIPPAAEVEIHTRSGVVLKKRVDQPRGDVHNRMSDDDLRQKFIDCVAGRIGESRIDEIFENCFALEKLENIGAFHAIAGAGAMNELRALQLAVLIASFVPISAGAAGILLGPDFAHGVFSPDLASHFRYLSGLLLGIGLAFLFSVPKLRSENPVFAVMAAIVFLVGLARLWWVADAGWPSMPHRFGLFMELAVTPALALWQRSVALRFRSQYSHT